MSKQVTLENTLVGGFGLPTGQIIPGNGSLLVEPEIWDASKDHPVVKARVDAGSLIVDGKGKKDAAPSADVTVLQLRITELEATIKAKDEEITTLKAGQGSGGSNATYSVKEQSAGWLAVVDADGKPVTKNLRQDDVKDFDGLSDEDKTTFIDLHKVA